MRELSLLLRIRPDQNQMDEESCHLKTCTKSSREASSEVTEPADSLDLGTEAPDVRNWFPSYAYQSPELTSSHCFQDSLVVDGRCEDKGLHSEGNESEEQCIRAELVCCRSDYPPKSPTESVRHLKLKVPEYSDSLLSEPPDIRNWFPSYVYESPTLDIAEIGGSLSSPTKDDSVKDGVMEKEKTWDSPTKTPVGFIAHTTHADGFAEFRDHIEYVNPEIDPSKEDNHLKDQSRQPVEPEMILLSCGISTRAEVTENETVDDNPRPSAAKRLASETADEPTERACTDTKSENNETKIEPESGSGWISKNSKGKQGDSRSISRSIRRHKLLENGFAPTAGTNCGEGRKHEQTGNAVSREHRVKRALKEVTNVCGLAENEIAVGKWRCPQRGKPDVGPPLKQLRLEKWVRRV